MWVAPEVRRSGVGRRLLQEIEAWIASAGGTMSELMVTTAAAPARRLYESAGYEPDGNERESRHTPRLFEVGYRKRLARGRTSA
jgi:GNAT superfamily N-acetyltransferase